MSGKHAGIQKSISDISNLNAKFVAYTNQSLYLADLHFAHDEVNSVTFFRNLVWSFLALRTAGKS